MIKFPNEPFMFGIYSLSVFRSDLHLFHSILSLKYNKYGCQKKLTTLRTSWQNKERLTIVTQLLFRYKGHLLRSP